MPMVVNVEAKIFQVEKFKVNMLSGAGVNLRGNKKDMTQYPYKNKADGNWTVSEWIQNRFHSTYAGLEVEVLDALDMPITGNTRLKNVRKTYEV